MCGVRAVPRVELAPSRVGVVATPASACVALNHRAWVARTVRAMFVVGARMLTPRCVVWAVARVVLLPVVQLHRAVRVLACGTCVRDQTLCWRSPSLCMWHSDVMRTSRVVLCGLLQQTAMVCA